MSRDKQQLIDDLRAAEAADFRAATLRVGGRILRRRRRWRMVRTGLTGAAVIIASALAVSRFLPAKSAVSTHNALSMNDAPEPLHVPSLSDDELLALFPRTPVGLIKLSDGSKRLIFPRPGDEARFLRRL